MTNYFQNEVPGRMGREENSKTYNHLKKARGTTLSLIASLIFFMSIISGSQSSFHVTKFRPNQSIYFDKLSDMQIIRDEWKLIIYYDMKPYWDGIEAVTNYTSSLQNMCKLVQHNMNCDIILLQMNQAFSELEYYNQMLLDHHQKTGLTRQRRGLFNAVGYVAHGLFGILDENFAEQYRKDITLLRDNQRQIASYWKNQTSIIEAGYDLLKQTEDKMNKQHKIVTEHLMAMEKSLNELKSEAQRNAIINEVTVGAIIGSNMLNNLKSLQNTLLDTITDVYHGHFNPHLLTPAQLQSELNNIAGQLPNDVSLPIDDVYTDLTKIYKLLQVKARMLESFLIFEIRLPLISRDTFEMFKLLPIPQTRRDFMVSIEPVSEYLAINLKKDTYITISDEILRTCLVSDSYFCHVQKPIYRLEGDKDYCQKEESECKTTTAPCKNMWFESGTLNYYIYFCCGQCPLRIICDEQVTTRELSGAGMVVMDNGCVIKTDSFTVISHKQQFTVLSVKPDIYTPLIPPINHIVNLTIPHVLPVNGSDIGGFNMQLAALGEKIKNMKEQAVISDKISFHDIHHYTVIYTLIGLAAIIGLVSWCRSARAPAPPIRYSCMP